MSITAKALATDSICFVLIVIDQYLKYFFNKNPALQVFIFDFKNFKLLLKYNPNSFFAFGIPAPKLIIILLTILILSYLFYLLYKNFLVKKIFLVFVLLLIIYGAISNLADRLYYGQVIDYIDLKFWIIAWPIFNIADLMIVAGVICWLIYELKKEHV